MDTDERLDAIEARLDALRVPPVRDELLRLRDVHGQRLGAIEARLTAMESELRAVADQVEHVDLIVDRTDRKIDELLRRLSPDEP